MHPFNASSHFEVQKRKDMIIHFISDYGVLKLMDIQMLRQTVSENVHHVLQRSLFELFPIHKRDDASDPDIIASGFRPDQKDGLVLVSDDSGPSSILNLVE